MDASEKIIVVGSGPNGLAAAITLARAGYTVEVLERNGVSGGGLRSGGLTLPGFIHDIGAAVLPMTLASPFFSDIPLSERGVEWIHSPVALAHPFDDGDAVLLSRSVEETAATLGTDGPAYSRLLSPILEDLDPLTEELMGTFRFPKHPLVSLRFALKALRSAESLALKHFSGSKARGFFAGLAAHSVLPLERRGSGAFGIIMAAMAHRYGWPIVAGGTRKLADALSAELDSLGGRITTSREVRSLDEFPPDTAVFLDVSPRQLRSIAGERLTGGYKRKLANYRYGPGVFKVDWALDGPIPWENAGCAQALTVHLGGEFEEIALSERGAWKCVDAERPFVILVQPSLFDLSRAPEGKHTAWAYCHVPNSSRVDMTELIERQVERFAPGFGKKILARHVMNPAALEEDNPNLVGGDITGGAQTIGQLFFRPARRLSPYATPLKDVFICSSSTPPGASVHGMSGYHAAQAFLHPSLFPVR